ncbi:MAG: glycine cleavage T C-terminal barrel domain-containing protein [Anaerolineales bacterium]|jgi:aminomethyltransferase
MDENRTFESIYRQAKAEALALRHRPPGLIWAEGKDRLDLLNRMSTNQLESLPDGRQRATVLTNPVGQTIDKLQVLALPDKLILITNHGKDQTVLGWLNGYIFFQDDVKLSLFEPGWSRWGLYGPGAAAQAADFLESDVKFADGELKTLEMGYAWPAEPRLRPGIELLLDPDGTARAKDVWPDRHADSVDGLVFDVLRIERGVPAAGREILEDTIPLEADLWDAVSFNKGCYIGQEIIARLESRGRLAKQLTGVQLDSEVSPPLDLVQAGHRVGRLTSVGHSPDLGWIGLALAKPSALETDSGQVQVDGSLASGRLVPLPFEAIPA